MQDLGLLLRQELCAGHDHDTNVPPFVDGAGHRMYPYILETGKRRFTPDQVRVQSTSFARAVQSAQGVLQGLFSSSHSRHSSRSTASTTTTTTTDTYRPADVCIDARHTVRLLPDPQPRRTAEQIQLEDMLSARPHVQAREDELLPLARRVTAALHPLLAADAHEAVFGAKQQVRRTACESIEREPLAWNQLAEITTCLACRQRLPPQITAADHADVVQHAAWRWFESFRHPRLAYLAMHPQCQHMVTVCQNYQSEPPLTLYSAHDSTLFGLLCAFKLQQPVAWPEYGSFLMMELLLVSEPQPQEPPPPTNDTTVGDLYIRFSLNGQLLRLQWNSHTNHDDDANNTEPMDMIRLEELAEYLQAEDAATRNMTADAANYRYNIMYPSS